MSTHTHPTRATCDLCAREGDVRSEDDAYICRRCDRQHLTAAITAASEMGTDTDTALRGIDAYLKAMAQMAAVDAAEDPT